MSSKKFYGLPDYFEHTHKNPPAPFNPEAVPYAAVAQSLAVKQLEEEGFYEKYKTPAERVATGMIAERYELICEEYRSGKRKLTKRRLRK